MVKIFHTSVWNNSPFPSFLFSTRSLLQLFAVCEPFPNCKILWANSKASSKHPQILSAPELFVGHPRTGHKMLMQECIRSIVRCFAFWRGGLRCECFTVRLNFTLELLVDTWMFNCPSPALGILSKPRVCFCREQTCSPLLLPVKNPRDVWKCLQNGEILRLTWAGFEIGSTESTNCHLNILNSTTRKNCSA